jgi:hypothetical protein
MQIVPKEHRKTDVDDFDNERNGGGGGGGGGDPQSGPRSMRRSILDTDFTSATRNRMVSSFC